MSDLRIILPGEVVSSDASYHLQGHGTYVDGNKLKASYFGNFQLVNQLAFVDPLRGRYSAQVGDVVVGVVQKIAGNCWFIEIGSSERVQLSIFQVNTDELANRRKLDEDLYEMNNIFDINDVISCEVQRLSTRTNKYGRLCNGILVNVKPNLMLRQSRHIHDLDCGVRMILGCNGFIWLSPLESLGSGAPRPEVIHSICTLRTLILCLARANIKISHRILLSLFDLCKTRFPHHNTLDKDQASQLLLWFLEMKAGDSYSGDIDI